MKIAVVVLGLCVGLAASSVATMAGGNPAEGDNSDDRLLFDFLMAKPYHQFKRPSRLSEYKFTNCGDIKKELLQISNLVISPDPVPSKGAINVTFSANVTDQIVAPVKASLSIKKQVFGVWIEVPCVDNFGSCDYPDFCQILGSGSCPPPFVKNNVPCHCPFSPGNYSLPGISLDVDIGVLPSGGYKAQLDLNTATDSVGCYEIQFSLA